MTDQQDHAPPTDAARPRSPRWVRWIGEHPPPGPTRRGFWRSPIRGPWLTAVFGLVLLIGITIVFVTGLLSYAAYNPDLGSNDLTPDKGLLGFYLFHWPTQPYWLYRFTQGVHVTLGLILVPVLLGKLWSVIPKLFDWPPVRSPAQFLERISLLLLVGGAVFEFVTGIVNIQYWYVFPASFYTVHLYGAWIFIAAFAAHVALKSRRMVTALRSRSFRDELHTDTAHTRPEPPDPDDLVSPNPAAPTISRRGALGLVGAGSLTVLLLTVGQSIGGALRPTALLAPRGQTLGHGPNDFQINKTAEEAAISTAETDGWQLELRGGGTSMTLTRDDLLAMPQHTAHLPIACVEGWSTRNQAWTGVQLRDLARLAGAPEPGSVLVESIQTGGLFRSATLRRNQVLDPDSLLALRVNDADLSLDHGYPARVIVPNNPGVHNTKWVGRLDFQA
ncbi:Oxidoreductase molybdopterin binding domain-containing protein [Modestobacter sp. DSM 44400]|uniref:molybdopterin-dependent oxidoreductase n=1 Tax=Modestobacter sp. DSM 44400 TaxID=1550230 RepID=UPI0008945784|nr:molybdopterin-dependent oxidoreductase [Modestobacter sp. DSM 44400]SDX84834.1 Oxidoreductase molybdopterin binding domain-containing protein [Modestobacter sp. DSM 44400]